MPEEVTGIISFPPESAFFASHFPGAACVPGSLVIEALRREALQHFPGIRITAAGKFRFRRFMEPGDHPYVMTFCREQAVIRCRTGSQETPSSTGLLLVAPVSRPLPDTDSRTS